MGFNRPIVRKGGIEVEARVGEGFMANPQITTDATAGNRTIALSAILGGICQFTGAAGAVTYTTPTAAALAAAMPDMDVGDSYMFKISNTAAQTATIAGGTNVTASGNLTVNAGARDFILVCTALGATPAFNLVGL